MINLNDIIQLIEIKNLKKHHSEDTVVLFMIIGIFIRNYKTYAGINYIPLTNRHSFCGLVGNNGIGKSSVLEALDSLLNSKDWNYNIVVKKSGKSSARPHIVPLYLLNSNKVSEENFEQFEKISDYVWNVKESDINPQNREQFKCFQKQRNQLLDNNENSFLIPLGLSYDLIPNLSIFSTRQLAKIITNNVTDKTQIQDNFWEKLCPLHDELKQLFEYIYIPKDIDPEHFTQLETKEIQSLMGETLSEIVEACVPQSKIQDINHELNGFIDRLSEILGEYSFRTPGQRQVNLRKHDVYKLIIDAYFRIRKLHKKEGEHWLELNYLSSGEKQKSIIELTFQILSQYRSQTDNLILGIDEPESSLHMSACYDQFNRLFEISSLCSQLLFTTHWYGFIPTIEDGHVSIISKVDGDHRCDLINIRNYRESIKQTIRNSQGKLPYDIRLKSLNDFIQSVITSLLSEQPFNWLICEGSSERLYFEAYLSDIKHSKKLRIIPVGGATEIKRIYNHLQVAYEDFKNEIQGKVILISDTDVELVRYPTKDNLDNLVCYRIVNDHSSRKTTLVKINSNPVSPKTEIEDSLNGQLFFEILEDFKDDYPDIKDIIDTIRSPTEESTYFALDLSPSKQETLEKFFDVDNNKLKFAKKYTDKINDSYTIPEWIANIKSMY